MNGSPLLAGLFGRRAASPKRVRGAGPAAPETGCDFEKLLGVARPVPAHKD